jgi:hypothetical protein
MLTWFESSGFLFVGELKSAYVFRSCSQCRNTTPEHCDRLPDYPQLSRVLRTGSIIHAKVCPSMCWIYWRIFWASLVMHHFSAVTRKGNVCGTMLMWTCYLIFLCGAHSHVCPHSSDSLCIWHKETDTWHRKIHFSQSWAENLWIRKISRSVLFTITTVPHNLHTCMRKLEDQCALKINIK